MYKIEQNRVALEGLVKKNLGGSLEKFLESLIEKGQRDKGRDDNDDKKWETLKVYQARILKAILFGDNNKLNTDGLMIARFLAQATRGGEQN
jgi:hypothetical protein